MKLDNLLREMILDEAAKFGKMKEPSSVKAKETEADELADSLEKHEDFTVKEQRDVVNAIAHARRLRLEEARLIRQVKRIRQARKNIAEKLQRLV